MKTTFNDVYGYEEIKAELIQIADMIKNPRKYETLGAGIPKGVLIYGEPGLGKTLMSKALINESGLRHYTVRRTGKDSNVIESIISAFQYAKKNSPYIVFLDDMDKYANADERHRDAEEYVTIQNCIDDVKESNVLVIATVNDMGKLPDSLIRSGRFDRKIVVKSPSNRESMEIVSHYMKNKPIADDVNVQDIVKMADTNSCATLETTINEAAILAGWEGYNRIHMRHIVEAVLKLQYNAPNDYEIDSDKSLQRYVIHEAAHLVVAESLQPNCVGFATIRSAGKGDTKGFIHLCENLDKTNYHILIALAGKIATEMRFSGIDDGCNWDLNKASGAIARSIVREGTCGYGLLAPGMWTTSNDLDARTEIVIASELERYSIQVRDILIRNSGALDRMAEELSERQFLLYSDIQAIKNECPIERTFVIH